MQGGGKTETERERERGTWRGTKSLGKWKQDVDNLTVCGDDKFRGSQPPTSLVRSNTDGVVGLFQDLHRHQDQQYSDDDPTETHQYKAISVAGCGGL
jgi:hypothetical protein